MGVNGSRVSSYVDDYLVKNSELFERVKKKISSDEFFFLHLSLQKMFLEGEISGGKEVFERVNKAMGFNVEVPTIKSELNK